MSLRYPVTIQRRAAGARVDGRWVPGALGGAESILATVQPAVAADYDKMEPLFEGRRVESIVRMYSSEKLTQAGANSTASGDVLEWQGDSYEIVDRSVWQSGIIPHYRYLAARIVPERIA